MKKSILLLFLICVEVASAQNLSSIQLNTLDQKKISLDAIKKNTASVFVFLSPDCPLCRSYVPVLDSLQKKFSSDSIGFYGVFPGTLYSDEEILNFFVSQRLEMPYFVDDGMVMTSFLKATVTPEVFIVDRNGMVEYGGRIDDRVVELGKKKTLINSHELADALLAICSGKKITISKTEATGCLIEKK